jgi:hypothetical protein
MNEKALKYLKLLKSKVTFPTLIPMISLLIDVI